MDVYLVPLGRSRFECYAESADDEGPEATDGKGFLGGIRARFSNQLRDAERAHRQAPRDEPGGMLARLRRRTMRWIAERVAEQRLLWRLGRATAATLHVPDDLAPGDAERIMRIAMQRDADRHLKLLAMHAVGLIIATPLFVVPGPNVFGYFFTFTVVGHFLAWRGARRGASLVRWTISPNAELAALGRAWTLDPDARHRQIHESAGRLGLRRLATFVERMAAPTA